MLRQIKDLVVAYGQIDALHGISLNVEPVSYTHLDVYKRQTIRRPRICSISN